MSLAIDFTSIPGLAKTEFRLPAGESRSTAAPRQHGESSPPAHDSEYQPSYRMPDCVAALGAALRQPLSGMFAPGLAL